MNKILDKKHPMYSLQRELFYILRDSSTNLYLLNGDYEKAYKQLVSQVESLNKIFINTLKSNERSK